MTTAQEFIAAARAEIGYTEAPAGSNRTKFAALAGHAQAQPWCATFVVAIARRVGLRLPNESAYTPTMANGFKSAQRWAYEGEMTPVCQPGDLAFFDFPGDSKTRIQHVGIVESVNASLVTCIEGNTSSSIAGSQDNGGGVYRRSRPRSHVVGFGRPEFTAAPAAPAKETPIMVNAPPVALVPCATGGYWVVCADGGVFGFGGAPFLGSLAGTPLAHPIVAAEATPTGLGLYLLGRDGGVFAFGDAAYAGRVEFAGG